MHIIETDAEPDDLIMMRAHAASHTDVSLVVIVGEAKPHCKMPLVKRFYNLLQKAYPRAYSSVDFFQGLGSSKDYFDTVDSEDPQAEDVILLNYKIIYSGQPALVFMMKPPREALLTKIQCPNTIVFAYGSFNWRTTKQPVSEFQALTKRYERFYYYDSYSAIGEKNSFLFQPKYGVEPVDDVNVAIMDAITAWNCLILQKTTESLAKELDETERKRKQKLVDNVQQGLHEQFVMADICLLYCPLPTKPVDLHSFKNGYPVWTPNKNSNTFVFSEEGKEKRREELMEQITLLF